MSCSLTDHQSDLAAWCASYVAAFNCGDADAISHHWAFPALIAQSGQQYSFRSAEHFTKNTELLLGFYKREGVTRVERELTGVMAMNGETASITVADAMFDIDGNTVVAWDAAYVLHRIGGSWKAILALAEGELAAWRARGTPLGQN